MSIRVKLFDPDLDTADPRFPDFIEKEACPLHGRKLRRALQHLNDVKDSLGLWHQDGANALLIYEGGPDNGKAASYRQRAPVAMNPDVHDRTRTTEAATGACRCSPTKPRMRRADRTMTFVVLEHTQLADGTYANATLMAECYVK